MYRFAYLLLGLLVAGAATAQPTDLLLSEYVEGSSFNKALEFYNRSGSAVDLGAENYTVQIFFNGNSNPGNTITLVGSIAPGDVFVLAEDSADPAILAVADQLSGLVSFNGNDAVVLFQGTDVVDAIGQVGFDPGTEWGTDSTSTADNTLRRLGNSCAADRDTSDVFDPAVNYTGFPINTFNGLGSPGNLTCGGGGGVAVSASGSPSTIPPGGTVTITVVVTNNTGSAITVDGWIVAERGGNPVLTRLIGSGTIPDGVTVTRSFALGSPDNTPPGVYDITFNVGDFSTLTVVGSDTFPITVTSARLSGVPAEASADVFEVEAIAGDLFAASGATTETEGLVAYPNPAYGRATIRFTLEATAEVRLAVYDALGRAVAVLADGRLEAGPHAVTFDGRALPAGVYVYRLVTNGRAETGRLTLVQ